MNGNWVLGCQSLEGRNRLWMWLCRDVVGELNFSVMDNMLLDCCHSPRERFGGGYFRKRAIWKENCSDLPGQEL